LTGLNLKSSRQRSFITGEEAKNDDLRGTKSNKERITVLVGA